MRQRWTLLLALVLLIVAGGLRLYRLGEVPPGLFIDEGANGLDALAVLRGDHAVFFARNHGREGLFIYTIAPFVAWLGRTALALRLPAALASTSTVLAVFWLGQVLWVDRQGSSHRIADRETSAVAGHELLIGGAAAGLMAVALGQTILGRIAFRANLLPLLLTVALAALWTGLPHRRTGWLVLAGICTGLLPYTYIPARFFPLLLLLLGASALLDSALRQQWRFYVASLTLYLGVASLVAAPLLLHFLWHPADLFSRSDSLFVLNPMVNQGAPWQTLARNLFDHLAAFGVRGDPNWRHNFGARPFLNPLEALFFWLGLAAALWRWRQAAYRLLVLWFGVMLLPAVLAVDHAPNTLRMMGATPAVYLAIGVGLWHTACITSRLLAYLLRKQDSTPLRRNVSLFGMGLVALLMIGGQGVETAYTYFGPWATSRATAESFNVDEWIALLQTIQQTEEGGDVAYVAAFNNEYGPDFQQYNVEFLYDGATPLHIFRTADDDFAQQIYAALRQKRPGNAAPTVKAVTWRANYYADATGRIPFLLAKYGHPAETVDFPTYRITRYTDVTLAQPWRLYDALTPLDIAYDGGITLTGAAWGVRGGIQIPLHDGVIPRKDQALWLVLQWRADETPLANYRVSIRVHAADGGKVYQIDDGIWNFGYATTRDWSIGESGESLLALHLPQDLMPGRYEIRGVVYDEETLVPTVQVGVWEPEVRLGQVVLQ